MATMYDKYTVFSVSDWDQFWAVLRVINKK